MAEPTQGSSARLIKVLLWTSEIALAVAVVYALANRPAAKPEAPPTPSAATTTR